jgi:hypothetical protein
MAMKTRLVFAFALAALAAGCHREPADAKAIGPSTRQQSADAQAQPAGEPLAPGAGDAQARDSAALPAPSKDGLSSLSADPNPYIRNNAKRALSCWEAKDYTGAALGLRKILNLCRSTEQQDAAMSAMAQLKLEIDGAAAKGNANAKAAAAQWAGANPP